MTQLVEKLRQQVQDPSNASHQEEVSRIRTQLGDVLAQAPSNEFSPAWRLAVEELGVSDLLGERLRERIEGVLERHAITPSAAADELEGVAERLRAFDEALSGLLTALHFFEIGAEDLAPGEFEVGFLIPRDAVDNEFGQLGQEFVKLEWILRPFLELAEGTRPKLEVRSISSSAFQAFLVSTPALALLVAKTIESLVNSYEKILTIRSSHEQMKQAGVPDEALERIAEHVTERMQEDIRELADELIAEAQIASEARANELRNELEKALNAIANRIDRGYNVEVRAGEVEPPDEEDEEQEDLDPAEEQLRQVSEEISSKQAKLQFMNVTGKPILELPESIECSGEEEPDGAAEDQKPPT